MLHDETRARTLIDAYFDGWNAHDPDAVARTFAPHGTYWDPTTERPVAAKDIARVIEPLCAAFPDLAFERSEAFGDGGRFVVEWVLRGHNRGPLRAGLDATDQRVELRGVDV
jgi:uncharacterized protein (TIGR02246 family)